MRHRVALFVPPENTYSVGTGRASVSTEDPGWIY